MLLFFLLLLPTLGKCNSGLFVSANSHSKFQGRRLDGGFQFRRRKCKTTQLRSSDGREGCRDRGVAGRVEVGVGDDGSHRR